MRQKIFKLGESGLMLNDNILFNNYDNYNNNSATNNKNNNNVGFVANTLKLSYHLAQDAQYSHQF